LTIAGRVDDIRPYLARAAVLVAPIRMGSGTRSKILTAMAAGVPVVSTPTGCEGLGAEDGRDILIGRTEAEFAGQVLRALGDPELRRGLAAGGRRLVEARFSSRAVGETLRALWKKLEREAAGRA